MIRSGVSQMTESSDPSFQNDINENGPFTQNWSLSNLWSRYDSEIKHVQCSDSIDSKTLSIIHRYDNYLSVDYSKRYGRSIIQSQSDKYAAWSVVVLVKFSMTDLFPVSPSITNLNVTFFRHEDGPVTEYQCIRVNRYYDFPVRTLDESNTWPQSALSYPYTF